MCFQILSVCVCLCVCVPRFTWCHFPPAVLQAIQLLLCDWLLATRTELWEMWQSGDKGDKPASQMELIAFQQDLGSLRKLSQINKAALPKVGFLCWLDFSKWSQGKLCYTF